MLSDRFNLVKYLPVARVLGSLRPSGSQPGGRPVPPRRIDTGNSSARRERAQTKGSRSARTLGANRVRQPCESLVLPDKDYQAGLREATAEKCVLRGAYRMRPAHTTSPDGRTESREAPKGHRHSGPHLIPEMPSRCREGLGVFSGHGAARHGGRGR